jgi:tetratricopeptide (TPR) repeat protein
MDAVALLFGAALSLWWVDPYGDKPYLPDSPPAGGVVTNVLSCAAAKGEIESISFSVRPERDMRRVGFVPSDLVGPGGAKIPASAADFALVKVWYRAGGRWHTSWGGGREKPELINNLVIHDDDLVRVVESRDYAKRTILLRIDYPERPAYVDMRKHGGVGHDFNDSLHPVIDPKTFVPFDLKKGRFQQYWFTWRIPVDAAPGIYRGTLSVTEDGAKLGDIPVEVEVYPFSLPAPRTHYDTSKPFISAWMGLPTLERVLDECKQMDVAERKVRAIYRSCAEHNAHVPHGPGQFKSDTFDDMALRSLIMMRQEGMKCDMLISGRAFDWGWMMDNGKTPPEQKPEEYEKALKRFEGMLQLQRKILDKYLGHHRCFFASADECATWFNRNSYGFWGLLHKYGFEAWTDYAKPEDISWAVGMNDVPASARHSIAWNWHKAGARAVTYAGPFTGPACPDIWRRTKGLRYYYADFDGHDEYCFDTAANAWNDFVYRGPYSQFQMAYLTYDGLISTLAWEGVREGLDDIRYLSLLRMRCEAALRSSDPAVQAIGRKNFVWMDRQDPESIIDLFAFRREVARRAIETIAAVGPQPDDPPPPLPPPELPPHSDDLADPSTKGDLAAYARALAKRNRYDLAIPLWEKIRSDKSQPLEKRFDAAVAEANLQSAILRREDAAKTLADMLEIRELSNAQRVRLKLLRAKLLMTDKVFDEEFSAEQLALASAALESALEEQGASHSERYSASLRLLDAYLAGGFPDEAVAFTRKRLEDLELTPKEKGVLHVKMAYAYVQKKDWDHAAQMFRTARLHAPQNKREDLQTEGFVAEKRGDWATAVSCYGDEAKTYSKEEEGKKRKCVERLNAAMAKLRGKSKEGEIAPIDDLGEDAIDLDE